MQMFNPPHPGEVLKDASGNMPITVTEFARHIGVARSTPSRVLNGRAGITPEISIRLSAAFGRESPGLWFNMQNMHDFWHASQSVGGKLKVERLQIAA